MVIEPYKEKQEHENGTFHRQYAKRGMRFKHKSVSRQNKTAGSQSTQSDSTPSRGSDSRYEAGSHSQVTRSCSDTNTAKLKHRQVRYVEAIKYQAMENYVGVCRSRYMGLGWGGLVRAKLDSND